jgi:hypothetical protein
MSSQRVLTLSLPNIVSGEIEAVVVISSFARPKPVPIAEHLRDPARSIYEERFAASLYKTVWLLVNASSVPYFTIAARRSGPPLPPPIFIGMAMMSKLVSGSALMSPTFSKAGMFFAKRI